MNEPTVLSTNEIKEILLKQMEFIDAFCREHNISYFLIGGSLLGAVRHKGFIPWDDDIDIGMLRKDYDKFVRLFNKEKSAYSLIDINNKKDYYLPFAKVIDNRTICIEDVRFGTPIGISVDVFPFDNCPGNSYEEACNFARKCRFFSRMLALKTIKPSAERPTIKNIIVVVTQFILKHFSNKKLIMLIEKNITKFKEYDSTYIGELSYMPYGNKEIYKKEWLEQTSKLPFEQYLFSVPKDYINFLTRTFGDYMQLPPAEKRVSHHDYVAYWK